MELSEIAQISIESSVSILILTFAYKMYRARVSTESEGHLCKWLTFHVKTENTGGQDIQNTI